MRISKLTTTTRSEVTGCPCISWAQAYQKPGQKCNMTSKTDKRHLLSHHQMHGSKSILRFQLYSNSRIFAYIKITLGWAQNLWLWRYCLRWTLHRQKPVSLHPYFKCTCIMTATIMWGQMRKFYQCHADTWHGLDLVVFQIVDILDRGLNLYPLGAYHMPEYHGQQ